MNFLATKVRVANRGVPPDSFLIELLDFLKTEPDETFAPIPNRNAPGVDPDIFADIKPILGPWQSLKHRRAAWGETARVVAGFESSWNFKAGVDTTNLHSMKHPEGQETGIFQVSFDSTEIAHKAMMPFAVANGINTVEAFIAHMKINHQLAFQYFARLSRYNIRWDGPLLRHEVDPWLSRASVTEIMSFL